MIPLIGYAPDANPNTPGVIVDCSAYVPSPRGMRAAPSPVTGGLSAALASACRGCSLERKLDGTTRFFAGTATKLYEAGATTWTDVTRTVGGDYTLGASNRWRFSQFGNVSLATSKTDTMQFSSSGAFANISGGIKAAVIDTVNDYIVACNTNEGTYGDSTNRWWVTPNYADWTPSIPNLIATGIITSSAGGITAVKRFGDAAIIYKDHSMHRGLFVGPPIVFATQEIAGDIGTPSQEAVAFIGTESEPRHVFWGFDDFYMFDGSRPSRIGAPVRETVFAEINRSYAYKCAANHDRYNSLVYFYYPSGSSGDLNKCVVYDYKRDRWGRDDRTIEAVSQSTSLPYTYADYGSLVSTYGSSLNATYDSQFWVQSNVFPIIFNSSHVLQALVGSGSDGSFLLGDVGDEVEYSLLTRIQPRFLTRPTSAVAINYYRLETDTNWITDSTMTMAPNGRFFPLREARWHRVRISTVGDCEISDMRLTLEQAGEE
jgi:hypothetical protein